MRIYIFFVLMTAFSCSKGPGEPGKLIEIPSSDQAKYCFFGDGGTGSDGQLMVAKLLAREKCDIYFYLGDLVYPSGIQSAQDPDLEKLFFAPYQELLQSAPLVIMMGNHDYKGDMDAWIEIASKHKNLVYPGHYFQIISNDICFLVLNTTDQKFIQADWLSGIDVSACDQTLLLGHHPLKSSGKHLKPYFPLNIFLEYAASKADVFVSGHDHHLSYEGRVGEVHQFVSGAAGQLRALDASIPVWGKSQLGYLTYEPAKGAFTFWGARPDGSREKLYTKKIERAALAND